MLRKINITLAMLCTAGALFCGAVFAYTHMSDIKNSKIVTNLQEGL